MSNLLAGIAALLPTYLVRFSLFGIPSTLLEVLIWAGALIGAVQLLRTPAARQRLSSRAAWLLPALLLLVGGAVGVLRAPDPVSALGLWKGFLLDPILLYVLALAFIATERDRLRVSGGLLLGGVVVAIWAFWGPTDGTGRALGPYGLEPNASANYLAFALAPLLPLLVYLGALRRWVWALAPVFLVAVVLSGSRAGVLAAVLGMGLAALLGWPGLWRSQQAKSWLVGVLLVGAAASWWVVRPNFTLSPEEGGRTTASTNVRFELWSATGELVRENPVLGVGLGNFQQAFTKLTADRVNYPEFIAPLARTPHTTAVSFWLDTTVLGLAAYFLVLVLVGRVLFARVRTGNDRPFAAALLGSWFVLTAHGLVDVPIWKNDGMALFWILVALSASLAGRAGTSPRP